MASIMRPPPDCPAISAATPSAAGTATCVQPAALASDICLHAGTTALCRERLRITTVKMAAPQAGHLDDILQTETAPGASLQRHGQKGYLTASGPPVMQW